MISQDFKSTNIDNDLRNLWYAFRRRWKVGFLVMGGVFCLAILVAMKQKPQYVASGRLLFKINRTSALTGIGEELNSFDALARDANPMITEIEVLRSVPIAKKALSALEQSGQVSQSMSPKEVLSKLSVEPIVGTDVVNVSYTSENAEAGVQIVNQLMEAYIENNFLNNRQDILSAKEIVNKQLPKARNRVQNREKALQEFKEKYQIVAVESESSSIVTKRDEVEKEIKDIQLQLQESRAKSRMLQEQLGMNSEQAIALRVISQSPKVKEALQTLASLQNQIVQKQEIFEDNDPGMVSLNSQIKYLEDFLEREVSKIPSTSTRQITISDLQDNNRDTIEQELTSSLAEVEQTIPGLTRKLAQSRELKAEYQRNLQSIPKIENEYTELRLQLEAAQSNYRSLLKSLEDITVAEPQNLNNVRIIESAQTSTSRLPFVFPLAIGLALAPVLAITTMAGLEVRDRSIKNINQLEEIFDYPIIGTIPHLNRELNSFPLKKLLDESIMPHLPKHREDSEFATNNDPQLVVSEDGKMNIGDSITEPWANKSFSMLQARLAVLLERQLTNNKVVVLSSAAPQEGKSLITSNLAVNMASLGKRVLVIDANLHQPSQHKIWHLQHEQGLSDIILGGKMFDILVHNVGPNLDILFSGIIPHNPYDVINSPKMKTLLDNLAQEYDYVLIDSPALSDRADALNLGNAANASILLVSRIEVLDYPKAQECQNLLKMTGQNVVGIVVNGENV